MWKRKNIVLPEKFCVEFQTKRKILAKISKQVSSGKITINMARKKLGLPEWDQKWMNVLFTSQEALRGEKRVITTKKLIAREDHEELVEIIIKFATEKGFTISNILEAIDDVKKCMEDNAVIEKEDSAKISQTL